MTVSLTARKFNRVNYLAQTRNAYYMQLASMVVNVYDIVITLDTEIDLVWRRPWKAGTLLYLCTRYFVLIESILNVISWMDAWLSPSLCVYLNILTAVWAVPIIIALIEALLILRVCLLFCNDRTVTVSLWALLFASTLVAVVFSAILTPAFGYSPSLLPPLYGCQYTNNARNENLQTYIWIPSIIVEVVLVILTIFKTCQHLRSSTNVRSALTIILRDGCLYFVVVLGLMVANAVDMRLPGLGGYDGAILQPELSISSALCARMFLNLRKSIYRLKDAQARAWEGVSPGDEGPEETGKQITSTSVATPAASTTWGTV